MQRGRAQAIVEFALVGGLFLLLVMGTFDVARAYLAYTVLANAANEAGRYGAAHLGETGWDTAAAQAGMNLAVGVDAHALQLVVTQTTIGGLPGVAVSASYAFHSVVPGVGALLGDPLTMQVSATLPAG